MNAPKDFYAEMLRVSALLVPRLVEEGRRIGKAPFCVDGIAEQAAAQILGPGYPQESHEEYRFRHFQSRQPCSCQWCEEFRWNALEQG